MTAREWLLTADIKEIEQAMIETDYSLADVIGDMRNVIINDEILTERMYNFMWMNLARAIENAYEWRESVTDSEDQS